MNRKEYNKKYYQKNKEKYKNHRQKNKEYYKEYGKKYYQKNKEELRKDAKKRQLLREYNLSKEEFEKIFLKQNCECAICHKLFENMPCVDHNHKTNKVRGLLCISCNVLIAMAQDDIIILENTIKYLRENDG